MFITCTYLLQNHSTNAREETIDEVVSIVKNIRTSDLKKCNVILDVVKGTIVKCRDFHLGHKILNTVDNPDYRTVLDYFQATHPKEIGALLNIIETLKA